MCDNCKSDKNANQEMTSEDYVKILVFNAIFSALQSDNEDKVGLADKLSYSIMNLAKKLYSCNCNKEGK